MSPKEFETAFSKASTRGQVRSVLRTYGEWIDPHAQKESEPYTYKRHGKKVIIEVKRWSAQSATGYFNAARDFANDLKRFFERMKDGDSEQAPLAPKSRRMFKGWLKPFFEKNRIILPSMIWEDIG